LSFFGLRLALRGRGKWLHPFLAELRQTYSIDWLVAQWLCRMVSLLGLMWWPASTVAAAAAPLIAVFAILLAGLVLAGRSLTHDGQVPSPQSSIFESAGGLRMILMLLRCPMMLFIFRIIAALFPLREMREQSSVSGLFAVGLVLRIAFPLLIDGPMDPLWVLGRAALSGWS
jgi:hypothetical protein